MEQAQIVVESLETRTSLSKIALGPPITMVSLIGAPHPAALRTLAPRRGEGNTRAQVSETVTPDDSGKVDPKDPGGVELGKVASALATSHTTPTISISAS